jgi:regulator of sigma E protease
VRENSSSSAASPLPPQEGSQPSETGLIAWLLRHTVSLLITAALIAVVFLYLDPIDTLKVVLGLGLVIFIHELGHFLAAKWCDVHVTTFSIGFGPALPFCSFRWGETTYKVGMIPLGGYVQMVGEGEASDGEEGENDPRSYRNKSVGQRMLIISAGVIMNVLLGMVCFVAAYLHGVKEIPATIGAVESGSAAWRAGLRTDDDIVRIASRERPFFDDLRPIVMSTTAGETVELVVQRPDGTRQTYLVEPRRDEGARFPQLGIIPPFRPELLSFRKTQVPPVVAGSAAAQANTPFLAGDRIVAMSDIQDPRRVTPLRPDPRDPERGPDITDYYTRLHALAGQPVILRVLRSQPGGQEISVDITVPPAFRADLGLRMRIGEIAALREGGPAAQAGVLAHQDQPSRSGDRIRHIQLPEVDGTTTWLTSGDEKAPDSTVTVRKLDPLLLPYELRQWAERQLARGSEANLQVRLTVLRTVGHQEAKPVELTLRYDPAYHNDRETITLPNSPVPLAGLGLAYWVETIVDQVLPNSPADGLLQPNDVILAARLYSFDDHGNIRPGEWFNHLKPHQWAYVDAALQRQPPHRLDLRVQRGESTLEVSLEARPDTQHPQEDRGLLLARDYRIQKADGLAEAVSLGTWRVIRFIKYVYMSLYGMIAPSGRISPKTMSGPLTIANVSYRVAGEDFWQFLLFIGMISVNLAVVNFLPIPVLDGGHMVFLILEKILGRPVPERLFHIAMYVGLAIILGLMIFVIALDIQRLLFGWF